MLRELAVASVREPALTLQFSVTRMEAANAWTTRGLPILMYHRIAEDGPAALAPYRVAPAQFERQLAYLRRHGYRTISLEEWQQALAARDGRIDDRVVAITFDDAYRDFLSEAWPRLRHYGFNATLFVPTDHVGGCMPPRLVEAEELKRIQQPAQVS